MNFNSYSGLVLDFLIAPDNRRSHSTKLGMSLAAIMAASVWSSVADTKEYAFSTVAGAAPGAVDGVGSAARFNGPQGVAVDAAGNVFVADAHNHTIRKITPEGAVSTLAGLAGSYGSADGVGGSARFHSPTGIAVDGAGNVYVADAGNNTIRKITPDSVVTTLAGSAGEAGSADGDGRTARFNSPKTIAVDQAGTVYVTDMLNATIRKITANGMVSTLAGSAGQIGSADGAGSAARFNLPSGLAVDDAGTLYVGDYGNNTIRRISPAGVVTTFAGSAGSSGSLDGTGNAARFNSPAGVALDGAGNLFVGDTERGTENGTIRKITPDGEVTTLAGKAGTTGSTDGMGSAARFSGPVGVAVDSAGNVYVADTWNCTVRHITPAGNVTTLAGLPAGHALADGVGSAARFHSPSGMAAERAGTVYVADSANGAIRKMTSDGVVTTLVRGQAGTNGMGVPFYPTGLTVDNRGVLYVTDAWNTVAKVTPDGQMTTLAGVAGQQGSADGAGGDARFRGPQGIAVDHLGNLYVADAGNGTIRKITPDGVVSTLAGRAGVLGSEDGTGDAARFKGPNAVAINAAGTLLYVADSPNNSIRQVTSDGVVTTLAGEFNWPAGVAVDSAGSVYVVDSFNQLIRQIMPDGSVITLAGALGEFGNVDGIGSAARFFLPRGIAVDGRGTLYVADNGNNTIRKGVPSLPDQPMTQQTQANHQAFTLGTTPQTATTWNWQLIRRPPGSTSELSSTTSPNPEFTPDVSDLYVIELRAGNADGNLSIRTLMLNASTTPRLTVLGFAGNSFNLSVPSSIGTTCVLEYKDSLSAPNWSALPEASSSGSVLTLTDSAATNAQRFYRLRLTSP